MDEEEMGKSMGEFANDFMVFCISLNEILKDVGIETIKYQSMATIKEVTRYVFKGKEYKTLIDIQEEVHNTIGLEVLDKVMRVCLPQKHKDLHNLLDLLCSKEVREVPIDCYTNIVEIYGESQDWCETINVLDIKK